ncbi:MAG TPA: hypothetical protein VF893_02860 [Candidatus Bathyarchaeia archaeon]
MAKSAVAMFPLLVSSRIFSPLSFSGAISSAVEAGLAGGEIDESGIHVLSALRQHLAERDPGEAANDGGAGEFPCFRTKSASGEETGKIPF